MSNRKKIASIAFTGAAATAATMMGITPALAASHYTVKNGGALYTGTVAGKLKAGTTAVLVDTTKNTTFTCRKATFSGTISRDSGSVPWPIGIMKPHPPRWSSCTGPFGLPLTIQIPSLSAPLWLSKATTTDAIGKLSRKISGHIVGTGSFGACKATISATSVPLKYVNATHSLDVNSGHKATFTVKSATTGCLGAIAAGDKAYLAANFHASTPANLTIS